MMQLAVDCCRAAVFDVAENNFIQVLMLSLTLHFQKAGEILHHWLSLGAF